MSTVDTLQIHIKHLQTGLIKEESFLGELITILKRKDVVYGMACFRNGGLLGEGKTWY